MGVLTSFSLPGSLSDAHPEAWHERVRAIFAEFTGKFPQFYDPTVDDTPDDARTAPIAWSAFPASLLITATSQEGRWDAADTTPNRAAQDEYCEWAVERNAQRKITAVTFTTELPEYWEHLAENDRIRLVALYQELVSADVVEDDLFTDDGQYNSLNEWNLGRDGRIAHLIQGNNSLGAAVRLAAEATILRERNGLPVKNKQDLVDCARLGNPFRNSDPQVAAAVNDAAATGAEVTFQDPVGLYIQKLGTGGMSTPNGEDAAAFWTIERGELGRALRVRFAVPEDRGFVVGDIEMDGRPIEFGAQLADRVTVVINAVIKPESHQPHRQPCLP